MGACQFIVLTISAGFVVAHDNTTQVDQVWSGNERPTNYKGVYEIINPGLFEEQEVDPSIREIIGNPEVERDDPNSLGYRSHGAEPDEFDVWARQEYDDPQSQRRAAWAIRQAAAEGLKIERYDDHDGPGSALDRELAAARAELQAQA
jgi:hypothetical protein